MHLYTVFFFFHNINFILVCTSYTDLSGNNNTIVSARLTNHTTKSVLKCLMSIKGAGEYFIQVSYSMGARVREYCILLVSMKFNFYLSSIAGASKRFTLLLGGNKYQPMCIYPTANPSGSHASILGFICTLYLRYLPVQLTSSSKARQYVHR